MYFTITMPICVCIKFGFCGVCEAGLVNIGKSQLEEWGTNI